MGSKEEGHRRSVILNTSRGHETNMTIDVDLDCMAVVVSVIFLHFKACGWILNKR